MAEGRLLAGTGRALAALWLAVSLCGAASADPLGTELFLQTLRGEWSGRATVTPRGPLPYDIRFEPAVPGGIAGVADTGEAEHHWHFFADGDGVALRFLTTFGGNDDALYLDSVERDDTGVLFRARRPPYLTLRVEPGPHLTWIRVYLHGESHVVIRLERRGAQGLPARLRGPGATPGFGEVAAAR